MHGKRRIDDRRTGVDTQWMAAAATKSWRRRRLGVVLGGRRQLHLFVDLGH